MPVPFVASRVVRTFHLLEPFPFVVFVGVANLANGSVFEDCFRTGCVRLGRCTNLFILRRSRSWLWSECVLECVPSATERLQSNHLPFSARSSNIRMQLCSAAVPAPAHATRIRHCSRGAQCHVTLGGKHATCATRHGQTGLATAVALHGGHRPRSVSPTAPR